MPSNTIWLKGEGLIKEAAAGGAVTPGHLIMRNSANAFVVHNVVGGKTPLLFALEKDFVGKDITSAYVSTERVQALVPQPGTEIYALLPANAAAIVIGDRLESNGDGTLRKLVDLTDSTGGTASDTLVDVPATYTEATLANHLASLAARINKGDPSLVATALEAVDNSAGGTPVRIKVETV